MLKKILLQFKLYYKQFNYLSFSIFLIPISNFISNIFVLKKNVKIINYKGKKSY